MFPLNSPFWLDGDNGQIYMAVGQVGGGALTFHDFEAE